MIIVVRTDAHIAFQNGCSDTKSNMRVFERKEFRERERTKSDTMVWS